MMVRACVIAIVAVVGVTDLARAQATPEQKVAAAQLLTEGRALLAAGDAPGACAKFEASYQVDPTADCSLVLADCAERANDLPRAYRLYDAASVGFAGANDLTRAAFARERADTVKQRQATHADIANPPAPAAPSRSVLLHEMSGSETAPRSRYLGAKIITATGFVVVAAGVGIALQAYLGPIKTYDDGSRAEDASGRRLGLEDCDTRAVSGQVGDFDKACDAKTRLWIGGIAASAGLIVGLSGAIYLATRSDDTPPAVAVLPALSPGHAGAVVRFAW